MAQGDPNATSPDAPAGWFATTHWSVVLAAGRGEASASQAALEKLCRAYWPPLYACVRRRQFSPEDAQDLTQEFYDQTWAWALLEQVRIRLRAEYASSGKEKRFGHFERVN